MTAVTTEPYSGLNLSDLLKQIYFEVGQVSGQNISYDRFPRWYVVQKLNDRQNKFVFHSQCLRKVSIIQLKSGYRNYKIPDNCMDGGILSYPKYFLETDSYQNLEIKDIKWLDDHYEGWLTDPSSDEPLYVYMGESYGNIQMMGVYPPPDTDGDSYILSPDTGITVGSSLPGTASNISGQATGGGATSLIDTTKDFASYGLVAGMAVLNVTDGSKGVVSSIATTTITLASALSGGGDNTFTAGDSYNILAGEYGVVTSWEDGDKIIFASEVGEIANITVPKGNIRIDYIPYPLPFPPTGNDYQFPEIPKLYHMDYGMGIVADLLKTFQETTKEFQRASYYENIFNQAVTMARSKKYSRPYGDKPVSIRPINKRAWRRNA